MAAPSRNIWRCLAAWILPALAIGLAVVLAARQVEKAQYIVLPIPSPTEQLQRGKWTLTDYSVRRWMSSGERFFIWRTEATLPSVSAYDTWGENVQYLDSWLTGHDWVVYDDPRTDPCSAFLAESRFLPRGVEGYTTYRHPQSPVYSYEPTVCVAAWPVSEDTEERRYHIVLLTVNPSPWTWLARRLELGY